MNPAPVRVHAVHWRPSEAGPLLDAVRAAGAEVTFCEAGSGPAITSAIRANPPDVVVIDLSRLPSHGKEIAVWLRGRKATRHLPIIFVDGDPLKVATLRELLPDAIFTEASGVASALASAPGTNPQPSIPTPMMQRYPNRTAAQKMGVRVRMKVAVMDAPRDYLTVLGEMPPETEIVEDALEILPVTLWFVQEPETFLTALPRLCRIAGQTKLWVLWRKGRKNGITQNFVRETAIGAGLVDYRICSVDGHWSGIAFARSRK